MKRSTKESGQAIMLMVLCMTCLLGFMGFAADVGILFRAKRIMQTAADAGAIAGALEVAYGDWKTAAQNAAAQNGVTNGTGGATVTVNNPPLAGPHTGVAGYVEVIASQPQPTLFMALFMPKTTAVSARSVAYLNPGQFCVYTFGTVGGASVPGIDNIGIAIWDLPNCGLVDNSDIDGFILFLSANYVGLVGNDNGLFDTITPNPVKIAAVSDPFSYMTEPSTAGCGAKLALSPSKNTASPGCYDGLSITGASTYTFNSGLYVFNGPVSFVGAGILQGTGVTFYFNNTFNFDSAALMTLSAPTTGAWNGVLFFESRADSNPLALTGLNASVLKGIIYLPNAALDISGVGLMELYDPLVVGQLKNTFAFSVAVNFQNYLSVNPNSPLAQATLAE